MLESAVAYLQTVPWYWILVISFFLTYTENLFPPSPSDALLLFIGSMVGMGVVGFVPLLIASTIGSAAGFATAYWIGYKFEVKIIESDKLKFISRSGIEKVEKWFLKYGYWMIVVNRFLSGTRAIIAFFAGISRINFKISVILSTISALLWNFLIIYSGMKLGNNWKNFDSFMDTYGRIVFIVMISALVIWFIYYKFFKKSTQTTN